jgi:hypothetical protein
MRRASFGMVQKVTDRCPKCGHRGPKDVVEGPLEVNWTRFWLLLLFTAGLGLIWLPLWRGHRLQAYCPVCDDVFDL